VKFGGLEYLGVRLGTQLALAMVWAGASVVLSWLGLLVQQ